MIAVFDYTSTTGSNDQRGTSAAPNALKIWINQTTNVVAYKINLSRAASTGNARVALFTHNYSTDLPDTLVDGSSVLKPASELTETITFYTLTLDSPLSISPGIYWLVQDDNAEGSSTNVEAGIHTGYTDYMRKLYNGNVTSNYQWTWALYADDDYEDPGYEFYYVDPSSASSIENGTDDDPYKSLQNALTARCNMPFQKPKHFLCRTSSSTADTTRVTTSSLTQWVSTEANYCLVTYDTGHRASANWDATKYHLFPAYGTQAGTALDIGRTYFRVDGIQIGISSQTNAAEIIYWANGQNSRLSNCLIKGTNSSSYLTRGISIINGLKIWNCVFYNLGSYSGGAAIHNHGDSSYYSCTALGASYGIYILDGTCVSKNCYASGASAAYQVDSGTLTKTTCASSDTTGSAGLQSIAVNTTNFVNVTSGSEDFHLPVGSGLIDVGTDTSGDSAPLNFTTDIDGESRVGTWDIGADEYVSLVSTARSFSYIIA